MKKTLAERKLKIGLKCIQDPREIRRENKIMKPEEREETGAEVEVKIPENLLVVMMAVEADIPQGVPQDVPQSILQGVHQRVLHGGHLVIRLS